MAGTHGVPRVAGEEGTRLGLRAIWISAVALAATAAFQLIIFAFSGSAALFADALGNVGDAATTIALALAFHASRRAADRRYTYGYSRLEDLAGVFIALMIWGSAALAAWESYRKLRADHVVAAVEWAMLAALVGVVGNELVARYKIAVGKRIGSDPLVADGQHARTDALASVAAFAGLLAVRLGFPVADPVAGFVIAVVIALIAVDVTRHVLARLMDAVDPSVVEAVEESARATDGVEGIGRVQARWAGRALYVTLTVAVDGHVSVTDSHAVAESIHHRILHEIPGVAQVDVHVDPWVPHAEEAHPGTVHHEAESPTPPVGPHHGHQGPGGHHGHQGPGGHHGHQGPSGHLGS